MNLIKKLFHQRKALLANGTEVREGDKVSFVNSDGITCTNKIKRRKDGTLFFWNSEFNIEDYSSATKTKDLSAKNIKMKTAMMQLRDNLENASNKAESPAFLVGAVMRFGLLRF